MRAITTVYRASGDPTFVDQLQKREEGGGSKSVRNSQGSGSRVGAATEMTRMICKLEMEYHSQVV